MKSHVEDLEEMFGGRSGVCRQLNVGTTALSNWTKRGVPPDKKHEVISILREEKKAIPDWLYERAKEPA